jgi:SAM-dependent methyltransferase
LGQIETGIRKVLSAPAVYDFFQEIVGVRQLRIRWIRDCLKPFPHARILDIGCGTAEILALLPMDVEYTGFDMSPNYLESARRRFGKRAVFTCDKVKMFHSDDPLEFKKHFGEFDFVIALGVLHHLNDEEGTDLFQTARKALKPNGRLLTMDPTFVPNQSFLSQFSISHDRGQNVRSPEAYAALGEDSFTQRNLTVWKNALWIPYDHALLDCRN